MPFAKERALQDYFQHRIARIFNRLFCNFLVKITNVFLAISVKLLGRYNGGCYSVELQHTIYQTCHLQNHYLLLLQFDLCAGENLTGIVHMISEIKLFIVCVGLLSLIYVPIVSAQRHQAGSNWRLQI